jgi:uncharacterized integral membrane protein
MKKNKGLFTFFGFILILLGLVSIILNFVGLELNIMAWPDSFGRLAGFVIKLVFILGGFILVYFAQSDFAGED